MKENKQQEIDLFLKKAVKDLELNEVSKDFTNAVLSKIERLENSNEVTVYRPLISKSVWWVIGATVISAFVLLGLNNDLVGSGWFSTLKWNTLGNTNILNSLPSLALFDSTKYGVVVLTIFVVLQIIYLKRYFTKRRVII